MKQEEYDLSREKWVQGMNGEKPRSKRPSDALRHSKMTTLKTRQLSLSKNLGVFWTQTQWNLAVKDKNSKAYGQPPAAAAELGTLPAFDNAEAKEPVVIRDEEFGRPIGTWNVSEDLIRGFQLLTDVADSKYDDIDPAAAFQASTKKTLAKTGTMNVGSEAEPHIVPTLKVHTVKKGEASDVSALDELFTTSRGSATLKQKKATGTDTGDGDGAKRVTNNTRGGSASRMLNTSEQQALLAAQLMRLVASPEVTKITYKQVNDQLDNVRKRLTPEILPIYTGETQPGEEVDENCLGMKILSDLRMAERRLGFFKEMLRRVEATGDEKATPQEISTKADLCKEAGLEVHDAMDQWLVLKYIDGLETSDERFRSALDPEGDSDDNEYGLNRLKPNEELMKTLQRKIICTRLDNVSSVPGNQAKVGEFLEHALKLPILCSTIKEELDEWQKMLKAADLPTTEVRRLSRRKRKYTQTMLEARSTGIEINQSVQRLWERRSEDSSAGQQLQEGVELVQGLAESELEVTEKGNLKKNIHIKLAYQTLNKVKSTGSPEFLEQNKSDVDTMQRYLVKVQNFLVKVYAEFSAEKLHEWINDKLGFVLNPRTASQPIFSTLNFQSLQDALMKISEEGAARFQGVADADAACHGQLTAVSQRIQGFAKGLRENIAQIYSPLNHRYHGQDYAYLRIPSPSFRSFRADVFFFAQDHSSEPELEWTAKFSDFQTWCANLKDKIVKDVDAVILSSDEFVTACQAFIDAEDVQIDLDKHIPFFRNISSEDVVAMAKTFRGFVDWLPEDSLQNTLALGRGAKKIHVPVRELLVIPDYILVLRDVKLANEWKATPDPAGTMASQQASIKEHFDDLKKLIDSLSHKNVHLDLVEFHYRDACELVAKAVAENHINFVKVAKEKTGEFDRMAKDAKLNDLAITGPLDDSAIQRSLYESVSSEEGGKVFDQYRMVAVVVKKTLEVLAAYTFSFSSSPRLLESLNDACSDLAEWELSASAMIDCIVAIQVAFEPDADLKSPEGKSKVETLLRTVQRLPKSYVKEVHSLAGLPMPTSEEKEEDEDKAQPEPEGKQSQSLAVEEMREQTGSGGDVMMLEKEAVEETREQRVVHEAEAGAEEPGLTAADLVQTGGFLGEEGEEEAAVAAADAEAEEEKEKVEAAKKHPKFAQYMAYLQKDENLAALMRTGEFVWGSAEGDVDEDLKGWYEFLAADAELREAEAEAAEAEADSGTGTGTDQAEDAEAAEADSGTGTDQAEDAEAAEADSGTGIGTEEAEEAEAAEADSGTAPGTKPEDQDEAKEAAEAVFGEEEANKPEPVKRGPPKKRPAPATVEISSLGFPSGNRRVFRL